MAVDSCLFLLICRLLRLTQFTNGSGKRLIKRVSLEKITKSLFVHRQFSNWNFISRNNKRSGEIRKAKVKGKVFLIM